ncbi:unnamed protein product [Cylindrotheca closterium]|uniref:Uncharacterized protein n=1 Tax=Cylindrotheca closterium TaxID=2856 RepID=A0AAD2JGX8_9STRA|nr:unnamed protein product [Cylindrotheca closterium]
MVFSLRVVLDEDNKKQDHYIPTVVSVKSKTTFGPTEVSKALEVMEVKTAPTNNDGGHVSSAAKSCWKKGGLCLLVLLGKESQSKCSNDHELDTQGIADITKELEDQKVVLRMFQVPLKDSFWITEAFQGVVSLEEKSEVLASQSFVGFH